MTQMSARHFRTAAELDDILVESTQLEPDCAGVMVAGRVYRLQPMYAGAPTWGHPGRYSGRHVDPARCEAALAALLLHLQATYDLTPE